MYFYEVAPADRSYHGQGLLTYSYEKRAVEGQIVVVKLRTKICIGILVGKVKKPLFSVTPITTVVDGCIVPPAQMAMFQWMKDYYPSPLGVCASLFVPSSLTAKKLPQPILDACKVRTASLPPLTREQKNAIAKVNEQPSGTTILHGNTGSGKTRVYLELAKQALEAKKSCLILTPEIALTPQLVAVFQTQFSGVIVTHSQLTSATRRNLWIGLAQAKKPHIVIGPRSALFMPLPNLGLIVVDEFHESAYKNEQAPHYHAVRVASVRAKNEAAQLVLGSATPPIQEYFFAEQKGTSIIRMQEKAVRSTAAKAVRKIVDLSDKNQRSNYPLLSNTLLEEIRHALKRKEQVLLFLNKRGDARLILCQDCGWNATCEKCDLPMIYHQDQHQLRCHTCGNTKAAPHACPSCGSSEIKFKSPGTKAIAASLSKLFPNTKIARFDKDNVASERLEQRHEEVVTGDIDILVGTQILAKGHDLPRLALVGILLADSELSFPDYSSEERSYQLLHQLAGRVGRGHRNGVVVVQTYNPNGVGIKAVDHENQWNDFYNSQLIERKAFGFPPFYHTLKIEVSRTKPAMAEAAILSVKQFINEHFSHIEIVGPSPSFVAKRNNKYSWQLIVKAKQRQILVDIARSLPTKSTIDIDPLHLL